MMVLEMAILLIYLHCCSIWDILNRYLLSKLNLIVTQIEQSLRSFLSKELNKSCRPQSERPVKWLLMRLKVSGVILFHYIGPAKLLAWPINEKLPQISICGTFKCIKLFVSPHQFWNFQLLYLACEVWLSEKFVIVNLTLSSFNFPLYFTSSKGRISITSLYWSQIHRRLKF